MPLRADFASSKLNKLSVVQSARCEDEEKGLILLGYSRPGGQKHPDQVEREVGLRQELSENLSWHKPLRADFASPMLNELRVVQSGLDQEKEDERVEVVEPLPCGWGRVEEDGSRTQVSGEDAEDELRRK